MELSIIIIVATLFAVIGMACVVAVFFGLPGTWILLGIALGIELVDTLYLERYNPQTFAWWLLIACLLLALLGELLEFLAGALGARSAGSTRRGAIGAVVGGLVGALAGVFIPAPIVGSLIGAVIGTFLGAIAGELSGPEGKRLQQTFRPATGATIGRILGTLSKVPIAVAVWIALSVAAFWP